MIKLYLKIGVALAVSGLHLAGAETSWTPLEDSRGRACMVGVCDKNLALLERDRFEFMVDGQMLDIQVRQTTLRFAYKDSVWFSNAVDLANGQGPFRKAIPERIVEAALGMASPLPGDNRELRSLKFEALAALGILVEDAWGGTLRSEPPGNPVRYAAYASCYWGCAAGGGGFLTCGNGCGRKWLNIDFD